MPNTSPVNDNAGVTEFILKKAAEANLARVYPIGAVSRGQQGEQLADIAELKRAGCVAVTDDGHPVATALLMRRALEYTSMYGIPVIEHCEEQTLKGEGVAHEGFAASSLGLRGIPGEAESIMALRDISLAGLTGGAVHIAHMSARQTLDAVRWGKAQGIRVTCEVTPHHFVLTDERLGAPIPYDTNVKMNPPLREAADRDAMLDGLADGSVDVIATDHAPHHYDEKCVEFDRAPFGITGLETAVSLCFDRLVHAGRLPLKRMIELLSTNPARVIGVGGGSLAEGGVADISILSPDLPVTVSAAAMISKSKNTPFDGWTLRGGVAATIVGGRTVYVNRAIADFGLRISD
jgi:dihydroorotase